MDPPHAFICSITDEVMEDPVMCTDGHTYERRAIEEWLAMRSTSPNTGAELRDKALVPNVALKQMIELWLENKWGVLPSPQTSGEAGNRGQRPGSSSPSAKERSGAAALEDEDEEEFVHRIPIHNPLQSPPDRSDLSSPPYPLNSDCQRGLLRLCQARARGGWIHHTPSFARLRTRL